MIHKTQLNSYPGSLAELAEEIGDLRYDALSDFFQLLSQKIEKDGDQDKNRGRLQLATQLYACSFSLSTCKQAIDRAWGISEPYI